MKQVCKFEASLVYRANSRTGFKDTQEPCLEKPKPNKKNLASIDVSSRAPELFLSIYVVVHNHL